MTPVKPVSEPAARPRHLRASASPRPGCPTYPSRPASGQWRSRRTRSHPCASPASNRGATWGGRPRRHRRHRVRPRHQRREPFARRRHDVAPDPRAALDGSSGMASIPSTKQSEKWHGDSRWDHAVGPCSSSRRPGASGAPTAATTAQQTPTTSSTRPTPPAATCAPEAATCGPARGGRRRSSPTTTPTTTSAASSSAPLVRQALAGDMGAGGDRLLESCSAPAR